MNLEEKIRELPRRPYLLALLILTAAGTVLRFYALGAQSVWFDESISGIAARGLLSNGYPVLPSGIAYTRAILHTAMVAASYAAFGFGELAGRIPAALLGVFSIPLSFLVGRKIKNRRVGLIVAFLVAFTTVQIAWSRQIRFYQQLQFFFLLSLYFFEELLDGMDWKYLLFTLLSIGCMTVSHDEFGYLLAIPFPIWFLAEKHWWLLEKLRNIKKIGSKDLIGAGVMISVLAITTIIVLPEFTGAVARALGNEVDYISGYVDHFEAKMGGFFFLAIPGGLLAVLNRRRNVFYLLSFLLPFYVISKHVTAFQHRYALMLFPVLFVLSALTIDYIYERLKSLIGAIDVKVPRRETLLGVSTILLIGLMASGANFTFLPKSHYNLGRTAPQGEFEEAYSRVKSGWEEGDVMISTLTPVTWYYLQRSDYWISFSHWGFRELPDRDHYTGAEAIRRVENLREITENRHGWIVIDLMGMSRADTEVLKYIDENFNLVEGVSGREKGVWVYKWC